MMENKFIEIEDTDARTYIINIDHIAYIEKYESRKPDLGFHGFARIHLEVRTNRPLTGDVEGFEIYESTYNNLLKCLYKKED